MEKSYFDGIDLSADLKAPTLEQADYSQSIDPKKILENPSFLRDLRDYYEEQEGRAIHWSDDQLIDAFYADSTWREFNTVSAIGGAFEPWGMGKESRERAKRIESVWKQLPMFWQEGGRGAATALPDILGAMASDPLNFVPVGAAYNVAKAGVIGGKTLLGATAKGVGSAALAEGGISGAQEGIVNLSGQVRDKGLGLRENVSLGELGTATAAGAVLGGVAGSALGLPAAIFGARKGKQVVDGLLAKGLTREEIARLDQEQLVSIAEAEGLIAPPDAADVQRAANAADEKEVEKPTIETLIEEQREIVRRLKSEGADAEEMEDVLVLLEQISVFKEKTQPNLERQIDVLERKGDEASLKKARKRRKALNDILLRISNIESQDLSEFDGDAKAALKAIIDNPYGKPVVGIKPEEPKPKAKAADAAVADTDADAPDAEAEVETPEDIDAEVEAINKADEERLKFFNGSFEDALRLEEAGIDPASITGTGPKGKVTKKQVDEIIASRQKTEQTNPDIQNKFDEEFDRILSISGKYETDAELAKAREEYARAYERHNKLDEGTIQQRDELAKALAPEKDWIADNQLTPDEIKQFKKIKRRIQADISKSPEDSNLRLDGVLDAKARTQFLNFRANKQGKARTTGESIERAGQLTTAGREPESGKIQGILKKGEFTGEGGGSPGSLKFGSRKFAKYAEREEAFRISKKARKDSINRLVRFVVGDKGMTVIDADNNQVRVGKGTTVIADGHTRKVYKDDETAFKRTGLKAPKNDEQERMITKSTRKGFSNEEKIAQAARVGDFDKIAEIMAIMRAEREGKIPQDQGKTTPNNVDIPTTSGSKRVIVQSKTNPNDVRIISKKQLADGKGIEAIIGQKGGAASDPNNWTIKYAPADTNVYGRKLKELFESLPDEEGKPKAGEKFESDTAKGTGEPIDIEDALELELEILPEDLEAIDNYNFLQKTLFPKGGKFADKGETFFVDANSKGTKVVIKYGSLKEAILNVGMHARWASTRQGHQLVIDTLKKLHEIEKRVVPPEGIVDTKTSRKKSIADIENVFKGYSAEEIAAAKRLIENLGGNPELGPNITSLQGKGQYYKFRAETEDVYGGLLGDSKTKKQPYFTRPSINRPFINIPNEVTSPKDININSPINVKLLHEVAHWGYDNILTTEDKINFLTMMSKYYEDGMLNIEKIDEGSYSSPNKPMEPGKAQAFVANALESPQEFFANQFSVWAGRQNEKLVIKDEGFWKKMLGYIKGTFDRYFYDTPIDPDLEPLFLKLLPNKEEIGKRSMGVTEPKTKAGKAIKEKHTQFKLIRDKLQRIVDEYDEDESNPDAIIRGFIEDGWFLANVVYNKKRSGEFKMMSKYSKLLIRERLKDINTIINQASGAGEGINWVQLASEIGNGGEAGNMGLSIVNPANKERAAKNLIELYKKGYTGEFKGGERFEVIGDDGEVIGYNYGNIKELDRTAMERMFDYALESLEAHFQKVEDTNLDMAGSIIEKEPAIVSKKKADGGGESRTLKRIKNKSNADFTETVGNAKTTFKSKKNVKNKKNSSKVNPETAPELASKSLSALAKLFKKHLGTDYGRQIAEHMIRKSKTRSLPKVQKNYKVRREFVDMYLPDLKQRMNEAIEAGDNEIAKEIQFEITRRNAKKKAKAEGKNTSEYVGYIGKSDKINRMIDVERNDLTGVQVEDGIPANARPMVKEILSYVTHRDPERMIAARTLIYRALNLMGKVSRLDDGLNPILSKNISRLINTDYTRKGSEDFVDYKGGDFAVLRNLFRTLGVELDRSPGDETVRLMSSIAMRATMSPEDLDVVRFGFNKMNPETQFKIRSDFERGTGVVLKQEGAPDEVMEEYMLIDWLSGKAQQYHAGELSPSKIVDELDAGIDSRLNPKYGVADLYRVITSTMSDNREQVAYMMNGLVKDDVFKDKYFGITTLYGDMFVSNRRGGIEFPIDDGVAVHSSYASDVGQSAWQQSSKSRREKIIKFVEGGVGQNDISGDPIVFYHGTPNGKALDGSQTSTVMTRSSPESWYGRGIYLTRNPVVAEQSYATSQTFSAFNKQISELDVSQDVKDELEDVAFDLAKVRTRMSVLKRENAKLTESDEMSDFINTMLIQDNIRSLIETEKRLVGSLEEAGIVIEPYVMPAYVQLRKPIDFRESRRYDLKEPIFPALYEGIFNFARSRGYDVSDISDAVNIMERELAESESVTGMEVYNILGLVMENFVRNSWGESTVGHTKDAITELLREMGHDGIVASYRNTVEDATDAMSGSSVYHEGVILFDPKQVKHVAAENFDDTSEQLFNMEMGGGIPEGTIGSIIMAMIDETTSKIEDIPTGKFGELLEVDGKSRTFTGVASSMIKKRPLNETEVEVIRSSSAPTWFQSQSDRINKIGARWLGHWYKNHFTEISSKFAGKFMPIADLMSKLPDTGNFVSRWFRKSTASALQKQPESHTRIVKALRRSNDSRQYKALSSQEREIVDKIRQTLDAERAALKGNGFHVGYRRNYLPQVWNQNVIRKNKDEFIQLMREYYVREQASLGKELKGSDDLDFANQIYLTLAEEAAEDGVMIPHKTVKGLTMNAGFENIDMARVLNIGDYPESLNALEKFLENDLDAILVKYLEGSTRRLVMSDVMGVNSHALQDYILASNEGADGIARLLSTAKVFKKHTKGLTSDGYIEEGVLTDTIRMPFEGNEFRAKEFAQELIQAHQINGASAAKKMLYDLMPKMSSTYKRRADAILGALDDFAGKKNNITYENEEFIDNAMRVAMKKPMKNNSKPLMQASKFIRTVNNVTLLGFTTLTSLGDIVLPVIRSGSFTSWVKSLYKFTLDPEYRRMLNNVGVAMENIVHERMVHMYGAPDNKLSHAFFNATLLTPWTDLQRKIAGATGYETFRAMQSQAEKHFKRGVPYSQQTGKYKTAHRFLTRYGLNEYLPGQSNDGRAFSSDFARSDNKVREAIIKFADESIFQPNPNDVPLWAQTPVGQLVFQLKSFPLMMSRLGGYVLQEANQGNFKPLISFATLGPAMGGVTLSVKDIVQSRGGEEQRDPEVRKRNIAKILGYDSKTHGDDYNDFLGWYIEGMMIMGGFGLLGDVMHSVTSQVDNGAYGQQRIWSTLLGPSYGLGNAAITGASGIQDALVGGDNSNAKERSAMRELATRLPILGGMRNVREGIVDTVAGEQGAGSANNGWGSGKWSGNSSKNNGWGA